MSVLEKQLKELREVAYKTNETVDRLENNWDKDRKDFAQFETRLAHLEAEFKTLREQLAKIPQKTQDKIAEAAESIIESGSELKQAIDKKKILQLPSSHSWWKFWK